MDLAISIFGYLFPDFLIPYLYPDNWDYRQRKARGFYPHPAFLCLYNSYR